MKLKFIHQQFQADAVNAVADLFLGQEKNSTTFEIVDKTENLFTDMGEKTFGTANALEIDTATMLKNMQAIQRRNNLPLSADLQDRNFCIEMEKPMYIPKLFLNLTNAMALQNL